ncbi:MAG: acyltransferase family protein [Oscillospiraceae bacterium]|nr:acyltransferase family protein [Oscillospiraceae bacterium]
MSQPAVPATSTVKQRFVGIDIVKIVACFLVVSVHFFLYSGFYSTPITKDFGQTQIYLRWIAYCCVPLFMITTGYLMKNKTLSKNYYLGALRVLILYLVISVICVIFNHSFHNRTYTAWEFIRGIFMYTDAQYAWYVEYYFTIFLLIPFINMAYNGMKTKQNKFIMLVTVTALTVFAQSLFIGFERETQIRLLPGYFTRCYPLAYYLFGAFIRDYPPKRTVANKFYFGAALLISLVWLSTSTFRQSLANTDNNNIFLSWHYNDYGSWPVFICSAMIFLLLFDITCRNKPVRFLLKTVGNATFAAYLISYIFDQRTYRAFVQRIPQLTDHAEMPQRCREWYTCVLPVFLKAMLCGLVLQGAYNIADKYIRRFYRKFQAAKAAAPAAETAPAAPVLPAEQPAAELPAEPQSAAPASAETADEAPYSRTAQPVHSSSEYSMPALPSEPDSQEENKS